MTCGNVVRGKPKKKVKGFKVIDGELGDEVYQCQN